MTTRTYTGPSTSRAIRFSALAEWLAQFRGQTIDAANLERLDGRALAVRAFDSSRVTGLIELDEPRELALRRLRPSGVATHQRPVSQRVAADIFAEGVVGFAWWSTLEASWQNVTLFAERALPRLAVADRPPPVRLDDPTVREAAAAVGVRVRRAS